MKKGDKVKIYNTDLSGKRIVEGEAKLVYKVSPFGTFDQSPFDDWMVKFPGDSTLYRRTIIPEGWE